jgi:quercetin 2,3-dioxygenase
MEKREIARILGGIDTMDGAGVRLTRLFGNREAELLDPFLLLDCFGSEDPDEYLPGFPRHPHRGIETVTYMLEGTVRHEDSMRNSGYIGPGDVQWMTAGSGIVHEEMPQPSPRGVRGLQLWVNLARSEKMCDPAYRGFTAANLPAVERRGTVVRVIAGSFEGVKGPVDGIALAPTYLDARMEAGSWIEFEAPAGETAFACVYEGALAGASAGRPPLCLVYGRDSGDRVKLEAGSSGCSLVFARGRPLGEPIAWRGPIVMNSEAELDLAFREYSEGTFIKRRAI